MINPGFYRNAKAYDLAFSDRDFKAECNFIEWCFSQHAKCKNIKNEKYSSIELASGPSAHAVELSLRGWKSYALDLSEEMLDYAKHKAQSESVPIKTIKADMIKFKLKNKVHVAFNFMESISHILTNKDMITHLKSVSKNLHDGGIYVIEATHPRYFFPDEEANEWTEVNDKMQVDLLFGHPEDDYDPLTQIWSHTTQMKIREEGKAEVIVRSKSQHRWFLYQEMLLLIEMSNAFSKVWFYGSLYNIPGEEFSSDENSDAMVIVLRK